MIANLASAVALLASNSYTVTRRSTVIVNGRRQLGSPTTLTIVGSLQPSDGAMVKILPEGVRLEDTKTLFTATHLQLAEGTDKEPDLIAIPNEGTFRAIGQAEWVESGNYFKVLLQKVRE